MGRKRTLVRNYDLLYSKYVEVYSYLEGLLEERFFRPARILELLKTTEAQQFFEERATAYPEFLHTQKEDYKEVFSASNWGITENAFLLDTTRLQNAYLKLLHEEGLLLTDSFPLMETPHSGFEWKGRNYTHIIYCNGKSIIGIPETNGLPLSVNKGQALLLQLDTDLPRDVIFKLSEKLTLCPWGEKYWWAGASFEWQYEEETPTNIFLQNLEKRISETLKSSFRVVQPLAGFRVSSPDRTAIAGWLPQNPTVGVLTATGTKGVLQAPAAAAELVEILFNKNQKTLFSVNRLPT